MTQEYDVHELLIESFYHYTPSLALAIIALVLFGLGGLVVGGMTVYRKAYRFMHIMTLTAAVEMAGYVCLIYAILKSGKGDIFEAYVCTQVFLVMAPNLIQACLYTTLGNVLRHSPRLTQGRWWLKGWVVSLFFVSSDILGITIQTIGISMWATSQSSGDPDEDEIHRGCIITLAGLSVQVFFFCVFGLLSAWAYRHEQLGMRGHPGRRKLFVGFALVWILVTLRNVYRFVEFAQSTILSWPPPPDAYVVSYQQVLFYCLDALPILLTFLVFAWAHPSFLLPSPTALPQQVSCQSAATLSSSSNAEKGASCKVVHLAPWWEAGQGSTHGQAQQGQHAQQAQQGQQGEQFMVQVDLEP